MSKLKQTFQILLNEQDVAVFDYADAEDFAELWKMEKIHDRTRILILWSETPTDPLYAPVNTTSCVSPLEWAVCFLANAQVNPQTWPRISVIPLTPAIVPGVVLGEHVPLLSPTRFPWLQLVQPSDLLSQAWEVTLRFEALSSTPPTVEKTWNDSLVESLFKTPSPTALKTARRRLELLCAEIRARLTESGDDTAFDRHALSNVIGPRLLAGAPDYSSSTLHKEPIWKVVQTAGLSRRIEGARTTNTNYPTVFIDDQAHHGWEEWIGNQFFRSSKHSLVTIEEPRGVFQRLYDRLLDQGVDKDALRFRLQLRNNSPEDELLILDLRLFSGREREGDLFLTNCLIPLARKVGVNNDYLSQLDAALGVVDESARKEARRWALPLIPAILNAVDFSLPVIVFSSTHDPAVIDVLHKLPNVVGVVRKPALHGRGYEEIIREFQEALGKGRKSLELRKWCRELIREHSTLRAQTDTGALARAAAREDCSHAHIEVYIDEAGADRDTGAPLSVGGVFAIYLGKDSSEVVDLADGFDELLIRCGLRYYSISVFGDGGWDPSYQLKKKERCTHALKNALQDAGFLDKVFVGFTRFDTQSVSTDPSNSDDQVHRECVGLILEILLNGINRVLHTAAPELEVTTSIFVARRQMKTGGCQDALALHYKSGLDIFQNSVGDWLLQSFGAEALRLIVTELYQHHSDALPTLHRCGSHFMPYEVQQPDDWRVSWEGSGSWSQSSCPEGRRKYDKMVGDLGSPSRSRPDVRSLLYLADETLGVVFLGGRRTEVVGDYDALLRDTTMQCGFDSQLDDTVRMVASAWRAWNSGRHDEAVALVASLAHCKARTMNYPTADVGIKSAVAGWLSGECGGDEFASAVARYSECVLGHGFRLSSSVGASGADAKDFIRPHAGLRMSAMRSVEKLVKSAEDNILRHSEGPQAGTASDQGDSSGEKNREVLDLLSPKPRRKRETAEE